MDKFLVRVVRNLIITKGKKSDNIKLLVRAHIIEYRRTLHPIVNSRMYNEINHHKGHACIYGCQWCMALEYNCTTTVYSAGRWWFSKYRVLQAVPLIILYKIIHYLLASTQVFIGKSLAGCG